MNSPLEIRKIRLRGFRGAELWRARQPTWREEQIPQSAA
jgi:hypothetical protein